jgi:YHS domain-containing protein/mono/diheme cytochrome c family protein
MPSVRLVLAVVVPFAPLAGQETAKVDFRKQVLPLLLKRCVECHGPEEQEGDLRFDQRAAAFPPGDEASWTIVPGKPDESELLRRVELPLADDDIMPAKGEPLTAEQQQLLRRWIEGGAEWPEDADAWFAEAIAAQQIPKITFALPELDDAQTAAIAAAVAALQAKGAVVQQVAANTRAVDVNVSLLRDKIGDADIALLEPLAPVLVWLNVSRTAITDEALRSIGRLPQLRRLHAANTKVTDAGLAHLAGAAHLEYLNLYGSGIGDAGLQHLAGLPSLQRLYVWQTGVTAAGAKALSAALPKIQIDRGDYVEERMAAAAKEIAERDARNKPVNDVCPVAGKPIDAAHTVEFEGRRVAFCCAKCKATFEKEPAKYADKLPKQ